MNKTIERQGAVSAPVTQMYPRVISGICEFCGVINSDYPSTEQYKFCQHFKGLGELRCSYCPDNVDPVQVVYHANMKIHGHPDNPNKLVVVCDSLNCSDKHLERFKIN